MEEPQIFFDSLQDQSSYIKVIGVGGGGGNAVNHMYKKGITGVDFIVANTDMKALNASPVPTKLVLGRDGLGVGGRPQKGCRAAEAKADQIKELFEHNTKMIFITAGMGGGTGTGAAPVIARIAKEIKLEDCDEEDPDKILVVAVVTTPFEYEGNRRFQQAIDGIEELRKYTDSILVINNEKLRAYGNLGFNDAFAMANDVLLTAVKGIAEIITLNAHVNIDFCDVNTVMAESGTALMGVGEGEGENRALQAIEQATTSVLLNDNDIAGAKNVLLYMSWSPECEITMDEMSAITTYLQNKTGGPETNVIWGAGPDDALGSKIKITLIATGFEQRQKLEPLKHVLNPDEPKDTNPEKPARPENNGGEPFLKPTSSTPDQGQDPYKTTNAAQETHSAATAAQVTAATATQVTAAATTAATVAPVETPMQAPTTPHETPKGRVFILDGEEVSSPVKNVAPVVTSDASDEISLISHSGQPAVEATDSAVSAPVAPAPAIEAQPVRTIQRLEMEPEPSRTSFGMHTETRAERIRRIHDMLRNEPNGPAAVANMDPAAVMGEDVYVTRHSSESEAVSYISPNGSVESVLQINDLPD